MLSLRVITWTLAAFASGALMLALVLIVSFK